MVRACASVSVSVSKRERGRKNLSKNGKTNLEKLKSKADAAVSFSASDYLCFKAVAFREMATTVNIVTRLIFLDRTQLK